MEDPVREISHVIHLLTQSPPSTQQATVNRYFTPDSSFVHPFVTTGSWDRGNGFNSRWAALRIYKWYKMMSPKIDMHVYSIALDDANNILYVGINQKFVIWVFALLGYEANVSLTSKLTLIQRELDGKFYIQSQEDLYQTTEFSKFVYLGIWRLVWLWQVISLAVCILMSYALAPISWLEEYLQTGKIEPLPREGNQLMNGESK